MAAEDDEPRIATGGESTVGGDGDPAADARADYDYVAGETNRPDLVEALDRRIDGAVRFDSYTRELYATDASVRSDPGWRRLPAVDGRRRCRRRVLRERGRPGPPTRRRDEPRGTGRQRGGRSRFHAAHGRKRRNRRRRRRPARRAPRRSLRELHGDDRAEGGRPCTRGSGRPRDGPADRPIQRPCGVLRRAGYDVAALDSGCCGMAGSFGYEAKHYSMSQAIGRILFQQVAESPGDEVVAPGASCRTQLGDRPDETAPDHPVERLASALPGPAQS